MTCTVVCWAFGENGHKDIQSYLGVRPVSTIRYRKGPSGWKLVSFRVADDAEEVADRLPLSEPTTLAWPLVTEATVTDQLLDDIVERESPHVAGLFVVATNRGVNVIEGSLEVGKKSPELYRDA